MFICELLVCWTTQTASKVSQYFFSYLIRTGKPELLGHNNMMFKWCLGVGSQLQQQHLESQYGKCISILQREVCPREWNVSFWSMAIPPKCPCHQIQVINWVWCHVSSRCVLGITEYKSQGVDEHTQEERVHVVSLNM